MASSIGTERGNTTTKPTYQGEWSGPGGGSNPILDWARTGMVDRSRSQSMQNLLFGGPGFTGGWGDGGTTSPPPPGGSNGTNTYQGGPVGPAPPGGWQTQPQGPPVTTTAPPGVITEGPAPPAPPPATVKAPAGPPKAVTTGGPTIYEGNENTPYDPKKGRTYQERWPTGEVVWRFEPRTGGGMPGLGQA